MFSPTVTELPRRLEPISRDTFNDGVRRPAPGRPRPAGSRVLPSNVIELRPGSAAARRATGEAA